MKNLVLFSFVVSLSVFLLIACAQSQEPQENIQAAAEEPADAKIAEENPPIEETIEAPAKVEEPEETSAARTINVAIKSFKFVPADIMVNVGDTVTWTNEDSAAHTVESSDDALASDELSRGDTYTFTFTKPGKHNYICGIHTSMRGSVTVQ